jgi:hypothetical protein
MAPTGATISVNGVFKAAIASGFSNNFTRFGLGGYVGINLYGKWDEMALFSGDINSSDTNKMWWIYTNTVPFPYNY